MGLSASLEPPLTGAIRGKGRSQNPEGVLETVQILLQHGADPMQEDGYRETPISYCATNPIANEKQNDPEIIDELLGAMLRNIAVQKDTSMSLQTCIDNHRRYIIHTNRESNQAYHYPSSQPCAGNINTALSELSVSRLTGFVC